jgi:hypothetical protein
MDGFEVAYVLVSATVFSIGVGVGTSLGRWYEKRRVLRWLDGRSNAVPPYTLEEFRPLVECDDPYRPSPPPKVCEKCGHPDWAHSPCSPMGCTRCDCQETSV